MPVPSNIDELLELIAQEIIDNNSGLIEEHTLRYVLNQLVKILDTKVSLISPTLTAEQLAIWKNLADFKASDSLGVITSSTVFPDAKCWGFAAPGTYPNADGTVIAQNNIGIITHDGNDFSVLQLPLPQATQFIPLFSNSTFPLVSTTQNPVQRIHENSIWLLTPGQTASSTDVPGVSDKWNQLGGKNEDVNLILKSFLQPATMIWDEITFPLAGENDNAVLTVGGGQYSAAGYANGGIPYSSLTGYSKIRIEGNFNWGAGTLIIAYYNGQGGFLAELPAPQGSDSIELEIKSGYEYILYTRQKEGAGATRIYKGKLGSVMPIEEDAVKKFIENHSSDNSSLSNEVKAQIQRPTKLIKLHFKTDSVLPNTKGDIVDGELTISDGEGLNLKKFAKIEVQGASSAVYPKKNWTLGLFNDSDRTEKFKLRVGNWAEHDEFVFKSNWIDATHARNLLSNKIWEDIVRSRNGYPKRENEIAYVSGSSNVVGRFDSGALCHVDGVPAEFYVNDTFYGLGNFNIGKKRENYDINQNNQNHIQLAAENHVNMNSYNAPDWEIRSPKTPDANFTTKINAWFASNALTGQAFKDAFQTNHDLRNAIDFYLLCEFIEARDMFDKNFILTSWDGVKFYFLPYDMDTTYGLEWDGASFVTNPFSMKVNPFWLKFYNAYTVEIKARYLDLKNKGVLTFDNFYKHADLNNKTIGIEKFKQDFAKWGNIPSNSTIYTSYPQLYDWVKNRLIWLDSQYL